LHDSHCLPHSHTHTRTASLTLRLHDSPCLPHSHTHSHCLPHSHTHSHCLTHTQVAWLALRASLPHTHSHCLTHTQVAWLTLPASLPHTLTLRLHDDSIQLFNCLPDVKTGGNLTMTIIAELFKTERVKRATDVYINFDGASDNICYHVFYGLAWLLYSARKAGWPLQKIHILRFKV